METKQVSRKLLVRLPIYLEYLKSLPESVINISATRIAQELELGDVMVRKDLAKISNSGRRKLGYPRSTLIRDIESVLAINSGVGVVVVGTGKMGQALLEYGAFEQADLKLLAGFDLAPPEGKAAGKPIYAMDGLEAFCRLYHVRIGIITVPERYAQQVCDRLVRSGVEAIWNFTAAELHVPQGVLVQNENLTLSLTMLRMQLDNRERPRELCS